MSELKKAIKQWKKNENRFGEYLTQITESSLICLEDEVSRGIIHGAPFSLDVISTSAGGTYDKEILSKMLDACNKEKGRRNSYYLSSIKEYIQEVLPIVEKGLQGESLELTEQVRLNTCLSCAARMTGYYR